MLHSKYSVDSRAFFCFGLFKCVWNLIWLIVSLFAAWEHGCVYFVGCLNLIATETFWVASLSQMLVLCRQHAYFLCVGLWETKFHIMIGYKGFYRSCQIPIQSASTKTWNLWLSHIKRRFWTKIERRRSWWHRDLWESYRGSRAVPECIFLS